MALDIQSIIRDYSEGTLTLEQANAKLETVGSMVRIDPNKNVITDEERAATVVDDDPSKVNGWGLLDVGIGKPDKVHIVNGVMQGGGVGPAMAMIYIGDKKFYLDDDKLVVEKPVHD